RLMGPVIGAALFVTLEHMLGAFTEFWLVWLGAILLVIVLFARGGIIGLLTGEEGAHV
ncbi:MAG: branched-chain amino acid ABC transporter permease, partial [Pseudomonadota bacterium]